VLEDINERVIGETQLFAADSGGESIVLGELSEGSGG